MTNGKKITIYDISKALQLSPGTISKIINHKGTVPQSTRDRVLAYVKDVGFVANANARNLKSRQSFTIGIVFHDLALFGLEHPFFGSILQAFKNFIEPKGYEIVFIVKKLGDKELTILQWCENKKVDGVLMITGNKSSPEIIELTQSSFPLVSVDNVMPHLTTVISDDRQGVLLGIQHFLDLGFKRIGAFSGPLVSRAYEERTRSFKELLIANGLSYESQYFYATAGFSYRSAYNQALQWIEHWKKPPEAVFCFSDNLAMGLIHALNKKGYQVPKDISVIGYDDTQFAQLFSPPLTTIRQNKKEIAETAGQILLQLIKQNKKVNDFPIHRIPVELVVRESTLTKKSKK